MAFRTEIDLRDQYHGSDLYQRLVHDTVVTVYSESADGRELDVTARDELQYGSVWSTTVNWASYGGLSPADSRTFAALIAYATDLIDGIAQQRAVVVADVAAHEATLAAASPAV